jgi:hypothetical protein
LARRFRYYGKKRGHRRTGSPALGSMGEAAFSGVMLLLGCCGLIWMLAEYVVPEWRANHEFIETDCRVDATRVGEHDFGDGDVLFRPEIQIRYEVDGVEYRGWHYDIWHDNCELLKPRLLSSRESDLRDSYKYSREDAQAVLDGFELYSTGQKTYFCWYDPVNPEFVVLVRGYNWVRWLVFTVPLSFIIIGAGGLAHVAWQWGKSTERRAVIAQRAGERERKLLGANTADQRRYPTVPQGADMTNSPGTKFKFRLPIATSPGWALFGTLAFCIVWNGMVTAIVAMAIYLGDKPYWRLAILSAIPVAAIGIWSIVALVRQLLVATGIGPTLVEISDHPLLPGGRYRVFLSQSGWLTVKTLRLSLVCEEAATYRQGTDARTETKEVHRQELLRQSDFEIRGGMPFEQEIELKMPEGTMHSFVADHNEIAWKLVVEGDVAGWPPYRRAFPLVVRPAVGEPKP